MKKETTMRASAPARQMSSLRHCAYIGILSVSVQDACYVLPTWRNLCVFHWNQVSAIKMYVYYWQQMCLCNLCTTLPIISFYTPLVYPVTVLHMWYTCARVLEKSTKKSDLFRQSLPWIFWKKEKTLQSYNRLQQDSNLNFWYVPTCLLYTSDAADD